MKTLNFNEMEIIEGGIKCDEVILVVFWLDEHGYGEQSDIVFWDFMHNKIQCT